jgi:hypothetical protein
MLFRPPTNAAYVRRVLRRRTNASTRWISPAAARCGDGTLCPEELPRFDEDPARSTRTTGIWRRSARPIVVKVRATCVWSILWAMLIAAVGESALGMPVIPLVAFILGSLASSLSVLAVTVGIVDKSRLENS